MHPLEVLWEVWTASSLILAIIYRVDLLFNGRIDLPHLKLERDKNRKWKLKKSW